MAKALAHFFKNPKLLNFHKFTEYILIISFTSRLMNSTDSFTNLEFLTNICIFFANEKTKLFWTNKEFILFFNCSKWEKNRGQNRWTKLVKTSDEFVVTMCFIRKSWTWWDKCWENVKMMTQFKCNLMQFLFQLWRSGPNDGYQY